MALYSPEAHESLTDADWSPDRARDAIRGIVADADANFDTAELWPAVEDWDSSGMTLPLTTLYAGASGAVWGLDVLRARGFAEPALDLVDAAARAVAAWRRAPDEQERLDPPVTTHASLFFGETGPLVVAAKLTPSGDVADALYTRVVANRDNSTNELLAGAPGTMLAAKAMYDWTGEPRWADAWRASAETLLGRRDPDGFWTYAPYGKAPGASHGIATNTKILLAGGDLLPGGARAELPGATAAALAETAVVEGGLANWPMAVGDDLVAWDGKIRLQWCHGGAGVVESAAEWLDDQLLLAGAELVWRAGPPSMDKGPGICHGTAGSGFALLKVFARTHDELWLERARRFAVHAATQVERWRARRGAGRLSLWTGDVGAALFLVACLGAEPALPVVDYL